MRFLYENFFSELKEGHIISSVERKIGLRYQFRLIPRTLLLLFVVPVCAVGFLPIASAQNSSTTELSESVGTDDVENPAPTNLIEVVLVNATRRERNPDTIPLSLAVVNQELARALGVQQLQDIAALVPNVEMFEDFSGAGIPTWIIRGVGLQDFSSNNSPASAVYMDEIYQTSTVMGATGLFDVSQTEILRGPQGGLYGRNTSGGAVLLNSNKAQLNSKERLINFEHSSWRTSSAEAMINIPLSDNLAMRVAGRGQYSDSGWQSSLVNGQSYGAKQNWDARTWFKYQATEKFAMELKIAGGANDNEVMLGRSIGLYDPAGTGLLCDAVMNGRRDENNCINFADVNRVSQNMATPDDLMLQSVDGSNVWSDPLNGQESDYSSALLKLSWQLPGSEFLSITAVDNFLYDVALDLDGSQGEYGHRFSESDIDNLSQEFRLLSDNNAGYSWMLGLVFSNEDFYEKRDFMLADNVLVGLGHGKLNYQQKTQSRALYGNLNLPLHEQLDLTLSARYTSERKEYSNGDFYIPLAEPFYFVKDLQAEYELGQHFSGKASLQWHVNDLAMVYGSISSGFKSGGFFGGFPFQPQEINPYNEEKITAWETGIKVRSADDSIRFNSAVFYYDYQDVQGFVTAINPVTGTGTDLLTNQGDAEHKGMELQLDWLPGGAFSMSLGLAYLDARFVTSGAQTTDISGQLVTIDGRRPYAPRLSGNATFLYGAQIGQRYLVDYFYNINYRSEFSGDQGSLANKAINTLPGYGVSTLGMSLMETGSPWKFSAWIKNLSDKTYRTRVKGDGLSSYVDFFGEPRSFGLRIEYKL